MRIDHWRSSRWNTGKLPRSDLPSAVTSSLASTVPRPGHQLTGDLEMYARRNSLSTSACSTAVSSFHTLPSCPGMARVPDSNSATRSAIGRAQPLDPLGFVASGSYQAS